MCVPAVQVKAAMYARNAALFEQPAARQCCAAAGWVRQRVTASYRSRHDIFSQIIQQVGRGEVVERWQGVPACSCPVASAPARPALPRPTNIPCICGPVLPPQQHVPCFPLLLQGTEEFAAAEARRPAVIAAEPTLHLDLSGALQQQPPRLDMCLKCARLLEQVGRWRAGGMVLWSAGECGCLPSDNGLQTPACCCSAVK